MMSLDNLVGRTPEHIEPDSRNLSRLLAAAKRNVTGTLVLVSVLILLVMIIAVATVRISRR